MSIQQLRITGFDTVKTNLKTATDKIDPLIYNEFRVPVDKSTYNFSIDRQGFIIIDPLDDFPVGLVTVFRNTSLDLPPTRDQQDLFNATKLAVQYLEDRDSISSFLEVSETYTAPSQYTDRFNFKLGDFTASFNDPSIQKPVKNPEFGEYAVRPLDQPDGKFLFDYFIRHPLLLVPNPESGCSTINRFYTTFYSPLKSVLVAGNTITLVLYNNFFEPLKENSINPIYRFTYNAGPIIIYFGARRIEASIVNQSLGETRIVGTADDFIPLISSNLSLRIGTSFMPLAFTYTLNRIYND